MSHLFLVPDNPDPPTATGNNLHIRGESQCFFFPLLPSMSKREPGFVAQRLRRGEHTAYSKDLCQSESELWIRVTVSLSIKRE